jgi:general secretion pathway protein D
VTDLPDRLDRVDLYLETLHERALRQVQIDARVIEVELSDPEAVSLDWNALDLRDNTVAAKATQPSRSGLRVDDVPQFLTRLAAQGRTVVLASPRLLVTNNQPALVRSESLTSDDGRSDSELRHSVTLGVVPQIASDGIVMLSISPIVSVAESETDNRSGELARTTREVDTLAMVAGGETIVISGFVRDRETRERTGGFFSRSKVVTRRVELLILITPTILEPLRGH